VRPPTPDELTLYELAEAAGRTAHAPYSGVRVGAALRVAGGAVITGANVENVSYGLTCCAERVAAFAAVASGSASFESIAIHAGDRPASPCGACRQVLAEFAPEMVVIYRRTDGVVAASLSELLPERFTL
jgi:cytidine deaminase